MTRNKVVSFSSIKIDCKSCNLTSLCLPLGLEPAEISRLDEIIKRSRPLHRGDQLFQAGEHFRNLYVIKTGSVKTYLPEPDGGEQVLGFHLPGEVIGMDGIEEERHHCSAKVLETSAVCEAPFERLEELTHEIPSLQHQIYRLMSKEIGHETDMLALLGSKNAEERLAAFVLGLSERFKRRGFSATDFYLSMSRHDIGSYLGLAVETISRLFSRFQDEGLLRVERKHLELTNVEGLRALAQGGSGLEQRHRTHGGGQS